MSGDRRSERRDERSASVAAGSEVVGALLARRGLPANITLRRFELALWQRQGRRPILQKRARLLQSGIVATVGLRRVRRLLRRHVLETAFGASCEFIVRAVSRREQRAVTNRRVRAAISAGAASPTAISAAAAEPRGIARTPRRAHGGGGGAAARRFEPLEHRREAVGGLGRGAQPHEVLVPHGRIEKEPFGARARHVPPPSRRRLLRVRPRLRGPPVLCRRIGVRPERKGVRSATCERVTRACNDEANERIDFDNETRSALPRHSTAGGARREVAAERWVRRWRCAKPARASGPHRLLAPASETRASARGTHARGTQRGRRTR